MGKRPGRSGIPVAIVGSGFSGLNMGISLKKAGFTNFTIFERADEVGGTWRDNIYPGCACDVPSHLYCYSFEPNPGWSEAYSGSREIQAYILRCAEKYGIRPHVRFNTPVTGATYDEGSGMWTLRTGGGGEFRARVLVSAAGGLSDPSYPDIEGLGTFRGKLLHTSRWDPDYPLKGRRVGVIGSGASAIQVVPAIAPDVASLAVYQRTPPWIVPRMNQKITERRKALYRNFPPALWARRQMIYWMLEGFAPFLILENDRIKSLVEQIALQHIRRSVKDPGLRRKVTPDYRIGCKRMLISNDWYPALQRPNVELVTDGITRITPNGIVSRDGRERELDAIVCATGFRVPSAGAPFPVVGRSGHSLGEAWRNGSEAYKGVACTGFPNLFFLMGPNTGPGHTSVLAYTEKQVDYIVQAVESLHRHNLRSVEVKEPVQSRFNRNLDRRMKHTVWTSGCASWYLAPNGRNTTLYPGYNWEYRLRVSHFNEAEYVLEGEGGHRMRPGLRDRLTAGIGAAMTEASNLVL